MSKIYYLSNKFLKIAPAQEALRPNVP